MIERKTDTDPQACKGDTAADVSIDAVIEAPGWRALIDPEDLAARCYRAARAIEPGITGAACVLFGDAAKTQALNAEFRGKDRPTNVLSFPGDGASLLGDIALSLETCRQEAEEAGVCVHDHAAHLIIHGLLHLAGYDHENDEDAHVMMGVERAILASLGIADPYEDGVQAQ